MLNVLYVRDDHALASADGHGEPFFYRGAPPRVVYRLRLGTASLLTAEPRVVSRLRERCRDALIDVIPVVAAPAAT